jgi:TRAP transporter TAXI family solute receptor
MAVLQLTPLHFVVRAGSDIRSITDLKGRRVSVGLPTTGTALTVRLIFEAFGITKGEVDIENLSFNDAARRLVDGTLDAMFDTAVYPADSVEMVTRAGGHLVPVVGFAIERLRGEYPFYRSAVIPRNTYHGVSEPVRTIGVDALLVCSRDLDEMLVHDLTKGFFEALPSLSSSVDALRFMDLEQSPATPIPLHSGAARFYRERELQR